MCRSTARAIARPADIDAARAGDPLQRARAQLLAQGARADAIDRIDADARAEIDARATFCRGVAAARCGAAFTDVQTVGAGAWR